MFREKGLGIRVCSSGIRAWGLGFRVECFHVLAARLFDGFRDEGVGVKVQGLRLGS